MIYKIVNQVNEKAYIGYTSRSLEERWNDHIGISQLTRAPRQGSLSAAIRKHGVENFTAEILYMSWDKEHTYCIMEPYFIKECDSYIQNGKGYNRTLGGPGVNGIVVPNSQQLFFEQLTCANILPEIKVPTLPHKLKKTVAYKRPPEVGKKISSAKKGRPSSKAGKSLSVEHRLRISRTMKGRSAHNKGKLNPHAAEQGQRGAKNQSVTVKGRRRYYLPNGTWRWVYPLENGLWSFDNLKKRQKKASLYSGDTKRETENAGAFSSD